jgi:hypothetical protein
MPMVVTDDNGTAAAVELSDEVDLEVMSRFLTNQNI